VAAFHLDGLGDGACLGDRGAMIAGAGLEAHVDAAPVDGKWPWLTSWRAWFRDSASRGEHDVVEPALRQHHRVHRCSLEALGLLEVQLELTLDAVDALELLLLAQRTPNSVTFARF
jgi:hypothetical protein